MGIYFDTAKFPRYADFAKLDLAGLRSGARVNFNPEKKNISDFALWKWSINENGKKRDMEWKYRDRMGFPSWHLEYSAIALKALGDKPDNATLFCLKELEFNKKHEFTSVLFHLQSNFKFCVFISESIFDFFICFFEILFN